MRSGKIIVNGSCGHSIGHGMKRGEIHINGDIEKLSDGIQGGAIYQNGELLKLVVDMSEEDPLG